MSPQTARTNVLGSAFALALVLATAVACASADRERCAAPAPWPEADALFQRDPRWLGGDAVYAVELGGDRILWLFGDSFVDPDGRGDRRQSTMVRNTIALQRGRDPERAKLTFHWGHAANGSAAPFFAGRGALDHWPLHGHRVAGGPLLLFQTLVRATPGEGLGFAIDGWRLWRVDDPDAEPAAWRGRTWPTRGAPAGVVLGTSVWRSGEFLFVLGTRGNGPHAGVLARIDLGRLGEVELPLQWWCGDRWSAAQHADQLAVVLDDAGPECSVHGHGDGWLHVRSRGFGASALVARAARSPSGPWGAEVELWTPPESRARQPFVYAGKAQPALDAGADWLAVSYAANSFAFAELFTDAGQRALYWPRFWRVPRALLPAPPPAAPPSAASR